MGILFRQKEVLIVILFFLLITSVNALNTTVNIDYLAAGSDIVVDGLNTSLRYNQTSGINWTNISLLSHYSTIKLAFNVTGNAPSYMCAVYANSTKGYTNLTRLLEFNPPDQNFLCVNDTDNAVGGVSQVMCPMWPTMYNLSSGVVAYLEFSLPRGGWMFDLRCIPQRIHTFVFNSTGIYDTNLSQMNLSVAAGISNNVTNIRLGDIIIINNTDENFSNMVFATKTHTYSSGYTYELNHAFNLSSNTSATLLAGPLGRTYHFGGADFVYSANITAPESFGAYNLTLNQTGGRYNAVSISAAGVSLNITDLSMLNNITVPTIEGNISPKMFINISGENVAGSFKEMSNFDYSTMDKDASCTGENEGNRFCEGIVNFTGSCKNDTNFFFRIYENCHNSVDDDGDTFADKDDLDCSYLPNFNWSNVTDTTPPKIVNTQVYSFNNESTIVLFTDESANVTIDFYGTDASCSTNGLNLSVADQSHQHGSLNSFTNATFTLVHELRMGTQGQLGFNLSLNTTYYYKIRTQDQLGNSALGNCLTFETTDSIFTPSDRQNFSFIPPSLSNGLENFNFTFTPDYERDIQAENGLLNRTTNATLNFSSPAHKLSSFSFRGVSLLGNVSLDLTGNLTSKNPTTGFVHMGVGHEKWLEIMQKLRPKEIEITMPSDTVELYKCDDDLTNCVNITKEVSNVATSTSGGGFSTWVIPTSLGFTMYRSGLSKSSSASSSSSTSAGGGGGAAGGPISEVGLTAYAGETKDLGDLTENKRVKIGLGATVNFNLLGEKHSVKVMNIDKLTYKATIEVRSVPQTIQIGLTEDHVFDLNGDGAKDLQIYLSSLVGDLADIEIRLLSGVPPSDTPSVEEDTSAARETSPVKIEEKKVREEKAGGKLPQEGTSSWWLGIVAVFVIAGVGYWLFRRHHM